MFAHEVVDSLSKSRDLWGKNNQELSNSIRSATKFHLGDLANWYVGKNQDLHSDNLFKGEEFADMRLPYSTCWMDFVCKCPACLQKYGQKGHRRGMLVFESTEQMWIIVLFTYDLYFNTWFSQPFDWIVSPGLPFKYNLRACALLEKLDISVHLLSEAGVMGSINRLKTVPKDAQQEMLKSHASSLGLLHMALLAMSCKNVGTTEIRPSEKLNRKRAKRHKTELFSYHVLVIKNTHKASQGGIVDNSGIHQRVHLCRGHFKTYTSDNPLFGRIVGRWWWQPHARGQNTDGIVMKDYVVQP